MSTYAPVQKIIVASNNRHKIHEIQSILGPSWDVLGASDVVPGIHWDETGDTFLANARIKINALRAHVTGPILADDSGLCVDALDGQPGVHSSRFGGVEGDHARNMDKLLESLKQYPPQYRHAHFYCLLLFVDEHNTEHRFEGRCEGSIALGKKGVGGFGYDPIFIPMGLSKTLAELPEYEKNLLSHRGKAMSQLKKFFSGQKDLSAHA